MRSPTMTAVMPKRADAAVGLLFLANECARRGLAWGLIEKRAGQSQHSRALGTFARTLEISDMAGLAGPFLSAANRVTQVAVVTRERCARRSSDRGSRGTWRARDRCRCGTASRAPAATSGGDRPFWILRPRQCRGHSVTAR